MRRHSCSKGNALIPCAFILAAILMLGLSSRQLVRESGAAKYGALDRMLALQAAEATLMDAEELIRISAEMVTENLVPVLYGSKTGNQLASGGRLQISRLPNYQIRMMTMPDSDPPLNFFRITAAGFGLSEATQVTLQSDYMTSKGRLAWREVIHD